MIVPKSVYWEIGNAFSAMLKRKRVSFEQVEQALTAFYTIPVRFLDVDLKEAVAIANRNGIYAYDAYLLASAMKHKAPLLSLDKQMIRLASEMCIKILEV